MKLTGIMVIRKASGAEHVYYRRRGCKLVSLPSLPFDHPDFLAAYARAKAIAAPAREKPRTGTIAAAIEAYLASDTYLALASSTRIQRRRILDKIRAKGGQAMLADLDPRHIRADISGHAPNAARNRLKCWRALTAWAVEAGLIDADPSAQVPTPRAPRSDGHQPWDPDDIAAFRDHWPIHTAQRLAFELLYWTAARMSDAVRLGPGMIDRDGWLVFRQVKTGGEVAVPFSRTLPGWAAHMQADLEQLHHAIDARDTSGMVWVLTAQGHPRSLKAASAWFSAATRAAGIAEKSAHGLRKTRARILAEAGASAHQIAAWTGHRSLSEVQHYADNADRRRMLSGTQEEQKVQTNRS